MASGAALDSSAVTGTGSSSENAASDANSAAHDLPVKLAEHRKHYRCATCHRKFVNRFERFGFDTCKIWGRVPLCFCCVVRFEAYVITIVIFRKTYQRHRTIYCTPQTHECPTCHETFPNSSALGFHQVEHQEELPFGCAICG